ncbi:hypothetical protein AAHC03_05854 [Spirometra sp. Aus1]
MPLPSAQTSITTADFQEKLSRLPKLPEVRLFVRAAVSERDRIDELETLLSKFQYDHMKLPFEEEAVGAALRSFIDVYLTMVGFVRNNAERPLLTALQQLEDYLQSHGTRYLLGDEPTFADCMLMPKLQHLRVILRACKQWDIPLEFVNVWKYVKSMYETPVFTVCCPCDRDILMHYKDKKALNIPEHLLKQAADTYLHACPTQLPA